MNALVLTVDDNVVGDEHTDRIQQAIAEAEGIDEDTITVDAVSEHPEWTPGDPCPECDNTVLSAMSVEEDKVVSKDGDCEFVKKGEALDGYLDYLCPECMTRLRDTPYSALQG